MGFSRLRSEKALILTGNKTLDGALNWLMEHERDADIDEPLQMVGSSSSATPVGVNLDDMDDDERAIYDSVQAKKLADRGVAFAGGANAGGSGGSGSSGAAKVSTLNMTTEEKMQWLERRRIEVKARKEAEKIEIIKEQEVRYHIIASGGPSSATHTSPHDVNTAHTRVLPSHTRFLSLAVCVLVLFCLAVRKIAKRL